MRGAPALRRFRIRAVAVQAPFSRSPTLPVMAESAYTAVAARRAGRRGNSELAPPLAIAGLCLLALALTWTLLDLIPGAQFRDALALRDFTLLSRPHVDTVANLLVHMFEPAVLVFWTIALVAVAIARGRPRVALAVMAVMGLAPATADLLKPMLAHPHLRVGAAHVGAASWPSGHSTAALALVLCAVLVAPARLRPVLAAVGGVLAVAVGCSLLILAWHMPSDVLGGYLLATLWMALAVAALRGSERLWPPARRE
jgi:membrane-associated phospholipid phosphatase